jgi:hypothetical protein
MLNLGIRALGQSRNHEIAKELDALEWVSQCKLNQESLRLYAR